MEIRYPANKIFILFIIDHFVRKNISNTVSTDIFSSLKNIGNEAGRVWKLEKGTPFDPSSA